MFLFCNYLIINEKEFEKNDCDPKYLCYIYIMKQIFYHATKKRFKKGQRLSALSSTVVGQNYQMSRFGIYMTTSPYPHHTIVDKAVDQKWFVYEVCPIGKVHRGSWDDFIVNEIEIISLVGRVTSYKGLGGKCSASIKSRKGGYRTKLLVRSKITVPEIRSSLNSNVVIQEASQYQGWKGWSYK
jgi:hypothetical protein